MTYQVLARKWRPRTFDTMVGQSHVLRALTNALDQTRLHHAYLFTGTRGVGKTSVARILAKALNCEQGVSATPCMQCAACKDIDVGCYIDLLEIDAASRTRVEDTREILDNVQYAPTRGRYKVYLIDEVHMLSGHSFNALLKTLEEPPAHVKFLLATTDPQKLPATVLSRCLQFHLKNLLPEQIEAHLSMVLGEEQVTFEPLALTHIARVADGSMRDALSLLDQAIAYGNGEVSEQDVRLMLGFVGSEALVLLLAALADNNPQALLDTCQQLVTEGASFHSVLHELLLVFHHLTLKQCVPELRINSPLSAPQLTTFAGKFSAACLQLFYQIALIGAEELHLSPLPSVGFEMTLLRMLTFRPQESVSAREVMQSSSHHTNETYQRHLIDVDSVNCTASDDKKDTILSTTICAAPAASAVKPTSAADESDGEEKTMMQASTDLTVPRESNVSPSANKVAPCSLSPSEVTRAADSHEVSVKKTQSPIEGATTAASVSEHLRSMNEHLQKAPKTHKTTKTTHENKAQSVSPLAAESAPLANSTAINTSEPLSVHSTKLTREWPEIVNQLALTGVALSVLTHTVVKHRDTETVVLLLETKAQPMLTEPVTKRIEQALSLYYQQTLKLTIECTDEPLASPARLAEQKKQHRLAAAVTAIKQDSLVDKIVAQFDGQLLEQTIQPLDSD